MIVEVPVIGALALHVLFYVKEGSFSFFELPVKQLQFSPCPFHSIPASIHLDLAGFGKGEPCFTEPEWLCKRDHLTFTLVHSDSSGFKSPYNFMAHQLCFIHRGKESIVIIHVMTGAMNTGLTLDPLVNLAGQSNHFLLGRLHTQRHPPGPVSGMGNTGLQYQPSFEVQDSKSIPGAADITGCGKHLERTLSNPTATQHLPGHSAGNAIQAVV